MDRLPSGCDLFLRREVGAAFRSGEHLMRIASIPGIEHATKRAHCFEIVGGELAFHEVDLLDTDAMLSCNASSKLDTLLQDVVACLQCVFYLNRIALVIKHQRMNVPVTGVEDIRDA